MSVREYVFQLLSNDSVMNSLGINGDTLYANGAPDTPPRADATKCFAVLRWGTDVPGLAGQRDDDPSQPARSAITDCQLWAYNRDPDYTPVSAILKRWRSLMESIEAQKTGTAPADGWIASAVWTGDGPDAYDDVYEAYTRWSGCTIIANGA